VPEPWSGHMALSDEVRHGDEVGGSVELGDGTPGEDHGVDG
jgi:hypothetical protein